MDILREVKELNPERSVNNVHRKIIKLSEEQGELSEAFLDATKATSVRGKTWHDVIEEAVDTAIVALDIALTPLDKADTDIMVERVEAMFRQKLDKWSRIRSNGSDITQENI